MAAFFLRKKSTIISTNLGMSQLADIYSERVLSRISSNYTLISLAGSETRNNGGDKITVPAVILERKIVRMLQLSHYADLKRIIAAVGGKARRITAIIPFLYESRQHSPKTLAR